MPEKTSNAPPNTSQQAQVPPIVVPSQPRAFPPEIFPTSPTAIFGPTMVTSQPVLQSPLATTSSAMETSTGGRQGELQGGSSPQPYALPSEGTSPRGGSMGGAASRPSSGGSGTRADIPVQGVLVFVPSHVATHDAQRLIFCFGLGDPSRPYACDQCGRPFREKWNLDAHVLQVHLDLRPCSRASFAYLWLRWKRLKLRPWLLLDQCEPCIAALAVAPHTGTVVFKRLTDLKRHQASSVCVLYDKH